MHPGLGQQVMLGDTNQSNPQDKGVRCWEMSEHPLRPWGGGSALWFISGHCRLYILYSSAQGRPCTAPVLCAGQRQR